MKDLKNLSYNLEIRRERYMLINVWQQIERMKEIRVSWVIVRQEPESLCIIYKQYIRSVLNYASPAYSPTLANADLPKLQTIQNKALKISQTA